MVEYIRPGETATITIAASIGEAGRHGAVTLTRALLVRPDGSTLDLTPASVILREAGTGSGGTGTVASPPSFSAGGGPGGEDIYAVALGSGEASDVSVGQFVRSMSAGKGGIYEVLDKSSDTLELGAATGEMDVLAAATLEKVTPTGRYVTEIEVAYGDLDGQDCTLLVDIAGADADTREDAPALGVAFTDARKLAVRPATPLSVAVSVASAI